MQRGNLNAAVALLVAAALIAAAIVLMLPEAQTNPPPVGWKRYEDESKAFEVSIPPDWRGVEKPRRTVAVRFQPPHEERSLGLEVAFQHLRILNKGPDRKRTVGLLREQVVKNIFRMDPQAVSLPVESLKLDGDTLVDVRRKLSVPDATLITRYLYLYNHGTLYILAYTVQETEAMELEKVYARILESFRSLGATASEPEEDPKGAAVQDVRRRLARIEATLSPDWPFTFVAMRFSGSHDREPLGMVITVNLIGRNVPDLLSDLAAVQKMPASGPPTLKSSRQDVDKFVEISLRFLQAAFDAAHTVEPEVQTFKLAFVGDEDGSQFGTIGLKRHVLEKSAGPILPKEAVGELAIEIAKK